MAHGARNVIEQRVQLKHAEAKSEEQQMRPGRKGWKVIMTWQSMPYPARLVPTPNMLPQLNLRLLQSLWPCRHSAALIPHSLLGG